MQYFTKIALFFLNMLNLWLVRISERPRGYRENHRQRWMAPHRRYWLHRRWWRTLHCW